MFLASGLQHFCCYGGRAKHDHVFGWFDRPFQRANRTGRYCRQTWELSLGARPARGHEVGFEPKEIALVLLDSLLGLRVGVQDERSMFLEQANREARIYPALFETQAERQLVDLFLAVFDRCPRSRRDANRQTEPPQMPDPATQRAGLHLG